MNGDTATEARAIEQLVEALRQGIDSDDHHEVRELLQELEDSDRWSVIFEALRVCSDDSQRGCITDPDNTEYGWLFNHLWRWAANYYVENGACPAQDARSPLWQSAKAHGLCDVLLDYGNDVTIAHGALVALFGPAAIQPLASRISPYFDSSRIRGDHWIDNMEMEIDGYVMVLQQLCLLSDPATRATCKAALAKCGLVDQLLEVFDADGECEWWPFAAAVGDVLGQLTLAGLTDRDVAGVAVRTLSESVRRSEADPEAWEDDWKACMSVHAIVSMIGYAFDDLQGWDGPAARLLQHDPDAQLEVAWVYDIAHWVQPLPIEHLAAAGLSPDLLRRTLGLGQQYEAREAQEYWNSEYYGRLVGFF